MKVVGYSLENASRFGWGPEAPPDPLKARILKAECVGDCVLDVGCGTGTYVDLLTKLGFKTIGVDPFLPFVEEAKKRRSGMFVAAAADRLPFADKSFDTVLLLSVLEHVDDDSAVDEAVRVARSRVVAQVPLADPPELLRNGLVFIHHEDRTHLREYTIAQLRDLFERHGCEVLRVERAYPANPRGLLADLIRLPRSLRFLIRAFFRVFKFAFVPHYSEAFIVAEPRA